MPTIDLFPPTYPGFSGGALSPFGTTALPPLGGALNPSGFPQVPSLPPLPPAPNLPPDQAGATTTGGGGSGVLSALSLGSLVDRLTGGNISGALKNLLGFGDPVPGGAFSFPSPTMPPFTGLGGAGGLAAEGPGMIAPSVFGTPGVTGGIEGAGLIAPSVFGGAGALGGGGFSALAGGPGFQSASTIGSGGGFAGATAGALSPLAAVAPFLGVGLAGLFDSLFGPERPPFGQVLLERDPETGQVGFFSAQGARISDSDLRGIVQPYIDQLNQLDPSQLPANFPLIEIQNGVPVVQHATGIRATDGQGGGGTAATGGFSPLSLDALLGGAPNFTVGSGVVENPYLGTKTGQGEIDDRQYINVSELTRPSTGGER